MLTGQLIFRDSGQPLLALLIIVGVVVLSVL